MNYVGIGLITTALAIGAEGLMAAPRTGYGADEWFRAKYGRSSPAEEVRLKAEQQNTAFREEMTRDSSAPALHWTEQYFTAKYGRTSPAEEARLKAEQQNTAFREEMTHDSSAPALNWTEQYFKAKYGRDIRIGRGSSR